MEKTRKNLTALNAEKTASGKHTGVMPRIITEDGKFSYAVSEKQYIRFSGILLHFRYFKRNGDVRDFPLAHDKALGKLIFQARIISAQRHEPELGTRYTGNIPLYRILTDDVLSKLDAWTCIQLNDRREDVCSATVDIVARYGDDTDVVDGNDIMRRYYESLPETIRAHIRTYNRVRGVQWRNRYGITIAGTGRKYKEPIIGKVNTGAGYYKAVLRLANNWQKQGVPCTPDTLVDGILKAMSG